MTSNTRREFLARAALAAAGGLALPRFALADSPFIVLA